MGSFRIPALLALLAFAMLLAGCTEQGSGTGASASPAPQATALEVASAQPSQPAVSPAASPTPTAQPSADAAAAAPSATPSPTPSATPALPPATASATPAPEALALEDYDGKVFTIRKPVGWDITVGGSCETFSLVIKDGAKPQRQLFYFGEVGPVYLDESQKAIDRQYMDMGGYPIAWYEMPVVKPLTPENFLKSVPLLEQTSLLKKFMASLPEIGDAEIISSQAATSSVAGDTKLMRALFKAGGGLGEGQFFVTVKELLPLTGYASGGIGYAFTFVGISAEKKEFKALEKPLTESINSFSFSADYVSACLKQQQQATAGILKAGRTLSETSDVIMSGWEARGRSDDIISEKRSDAILGRERVYDPDTGVVYDVNNGFYEGYDINRGKFQMDNLQQLPGQDWGLWTAAAEDAGKIR